VAPVDAHAPPGNAGGNRIAPQPEARGHDLLKRRRGLAEIPDHGRDHIGAVLEMRREIDTGEAPALDGANGGTAGHASAVHVENEAIVRGDRHRQLCRYAIELQLAAEMQHDGGVIAGLRVRDPAIGG
jgi:hypothetical protein